MSKVRVAVVMGGPSAEREVSIESGQAVMRDYATGVNYGASDPRKDGAAIPELPIKWQQ